MVIFNRWNTRKLRASKRVFGCILLILCLYVLIVVNSDRSLRSNRSKCIKLMMKNNNEKFVELNETLCSSRSSRHGLHQRVISVSAYRSSKDNIHLMENIWSYTLEYIREAKLFYPDWRVRVYYHNLNLTFEQIIEIEKRYDNVDFCDVLNIPMLGNVASYMSGRFHRFIAIADRFVDVVMSRDIDSPIIEREIVSVNQWILSNKLIHIMRDHFLHYDFILAGLWSIQISHNETLRKDIQQHLFSKSLMKCYNSMTGDQDFLHDFIWPIAQTNSIQHDSFHCQRFNHSIPFLKPKLSNSQFVGCRRPCRSDQDPPGSCPIQCMSHTTTDANLC